MSTILHRNPYPWSFVHVGSMYTMFVTILFCNPLAIVPLSTVETPVMLADIVHSCTSECRGGFERRQLELKGVEGGD